MCLHVRVNAQVCVRGSRARGCVVLHAYGHADVCAGEQLRFLGPGDSWERRNSHESAGEHRAGKQSSALCTTACRMAWSADRSRIESQNHTEWPRLEWTLSIISTTFPPQAGSPTSTFHTRPGCPGPHPTWPSTPPGMDGASTASLSSCSSTASKEFLPDIQPKSSLPQLQTISPCPAVLYPFRELTSLLFRGSL